LKIDKVLSLLSLATKAGKIVSGEFSTEKAIKTNKAALVIVADDASDRTKEMFKNMCDFYEVNMYCYADKESLGHSIGKQDRASLAVTDEGLAKSIEKQINIMLHSEDKNGGNIWEFMNCQNS